MPPPKAAVVAADARVIQRGRARAPAVVHAAAGAGGVAADGAVLQRGRAVEVVQAAAVVRVVSADGAVGQRDRAIEVEQTAAVAGGEEGAVVFPLTVQLVSVAVPPSLYRPPPLLGGIAAGDRQSRDCRRDTPVDLEHPAHARRR